MYQWRKLNEAQRRELLTYRKRNDRPWHSPPHRIGERGSYMLTAACYEHRAIIGLNPERMAEFSQALVELLNTRCSDVCAWCVLPNHYHAVVRTLELPELLKEIGKLHGRTSFKWNGEDQQRGRKTWCNCAETAIKSDRHFWAAMNYIHNNPVHHGYANVWQDWPFSSAQSYLEQVGRAKAEDAWREYPVLGFGKDWDPSGL